MSEWVRCLMSRSRIPKQALPVGLVETTLEPVAEALQVLVRVLLHHYVGGLSARLVLQGEASE